MKKDKSVVSIDFWNTLVKANTNGDKRHSIRMNTMLDIVKRYRQDVTIEDLDEAHRQASRTFDKIWYGQQRTLTTEELIDQIFKELDIIPSIGEMDELILTFQESLYAGPPELADHISEVLPDLAGKYRLALISDTMYSPGRVLREYLKSKNLYDYFDVFVFSDEVGYSKPNIRAFQTVLDATHAIPKNSYHIGDIQDTDIQGAKTAGMNAILYTGVSQASKKNTNADYVMDNWCDIRSLLLGVN